MAIRMQQRRGTAANWTSTNPILLAGEIGFETDTLNYKLGDGTTAWTTLAYKGLQPTLAGATFSVLASDPTTPPVGYMNFYPRVSGGRIMMKFLGPSGLDSYMQPALFGNGIQLIMPGSGASMTAIGGAGLTVVGTISHPALNGTSLVTQTSRFICTSAATAISSADMRSVTTRVWRGNVAGQGGFFHRTRFTIESATTNQQMFIGWQTSITALSTSQVPSALVNMIGIGFDSADTSLQVMTNDATGTATKISLGANFPTNDPTVMFDFSLFCAPNTSSIGYTVQNLKTGDRTDGTISSDLVATTTFLAYRAYMNNGGTAAAVVLGISRVYTETDY